MTIRKSLMALLATVAMVFAPMAMAQVALQSLGAALGETVGAVTEIGGVSATAVNIGGQMTWVATSSLSGVAAGAAATTLVAGTSVALVATSALVFSLVTQTTPSTVTR